ncbi:MAG TPA: acetyl-CoA carboxylase carboxyl transferase subunit beta [Lachnospiraceae bacterium]|nr:acetyl-CoA carboxylase carboxyl transferase subunit beta [Lachnospiraceae bacterium]
MRLFKKKNYIMLDRPKKEEPIPEEIENPSIPDGMWVKCDHCKKLIYKEEMNEFKVCPKCGGNFRMSAWERIAVICDEGSFMEYDKGMVSKDPMGYPEYDKIIEKAREKSGLKEGVISGRCKINGHDAVVSVMDSNFMMGSMGSVVGEKITRSIEHATSMKLPIVIFTASGGARMQEGIISLMQMAKTSAALKKHSEAGLLYITVMTDPTTGGVSASFASLGDIIIAEPKATIGFAGQRVIEGTINEKLPEGFQKAEFQLEHGFVDKIVTRNEMKEVLGTLLGFHSGKGGLQ